MATKINAYLKLARFDKPIGFFLLLWPTLWALLIATNGAPSLRYTVIFVLGVIIMRALGCVINDIADRNIDGQVARTKLRPLAAKTISLNEACALFISLSLLAFILAMQLNFAALKLAFVAFLVASFYPFAKRLVYFPQVILGIAFSFSVLMVFAMHDNLSLIAWLLFGANTVWTISYDTYYALADYEDDKKIGVKSPATFLHDKTLFFICILQTIFLILLSLLGVFLNYSIMYYIFILMIALLFGYQYQLGKNNSAQKSFAAFLNNNTVGLMIFIAIFCEYLQRRFL